MLQYIVWPKARVLGSNLFHYPEILFRQANVEQNAQTVTFLHETNRFPMVVVIQNYEMHDFDKRQKLKSFHSLLK